ncbi:MAG: alpha/beta hydrolase [Pseudomonadota bacterium]
MALFFVLSLALFWAFVLWRANVSEARAEAAYPPEGQFLEVQGHKVHAVVVGPETGDVPDLVLIHGSSGMTRDMTFQLAPALADRYRLFIFDRPGLGYSDPVSPNGATITQQAAILSDAARQLGAVKPIVAGHSYGGAVALAWAVHHPDNISALVPLSAASHPWDTGLTTYYKILSHPVLSRIVIPLISAFVGEEILERELAGVFEPNAVPEGYSDHFGPEMTLRRSAMRANALQRRNLLEEIEALSPRYDEIEVPVEILHGNLDWAVGLDIHSRPLAKAVPDAQLEVLEGQGHMIQHTAPGAVVDAIDRAAARAAASAKANRN